LSAAQPNGPVAPSALRALIVIPAFNEQGKIGRVVAKIPPGLAEAVLVVDDYSRDATTAEALQAGALVVQHASNLGVGAAIRTGIDYARSNQFDVVAILSGDDQHDPNDLREMLRLIRVGGYDFVQGSRRLAGLDAPNIGLFRRVFTWVYALIFQLLSGFACTDATNGGRAFRTRIFEDRRINLWQQWLNTYELEPYLLYKAVKCGLRITEAPMKVIYHTHGTTKMKPFRDWWRILRPLIYLSLGVRK
jgi:dolichol-phosphate mannosyltransferase